MTLYRCGICGLEVSETSNILQCGVCKTLLCQVHHESGACKPHFDAITEADKQILRECQRRLDKVTLNAARDGCKYAIACMVPAGFAMLLVISIIGTHMDDDLVLLVAFGIAMLLVGPLVLMAWHMNRRIRASQERAGVERARMEQVLSRYSLEA